MFVVWVVCLVCFQMQVWVWRGQPSCCHNRSRLPPCRGPGSGRKAARRSHAARPSTGLGSLASTASLAQSQRSLDWKRSCIYVMYYSLPCIVVLPSVFVAFPALFLAITIVCLSFPSGGRKIFFPCCLAGHCRKGVGGGLLKDTFFKFKKLFFKKLS